MPDDLFSQVLPALDAECAQAYGKLHEGIHIAGYSFERACAQLEWLLEGDRWRQCGGSFADVNTFLGSIRLDQFRAVAEARKRIAERIKELQPEISNRQIATTLGVGHTTINRDLGSNGPTAPGEASNAAGDDGDAGPEGPRPDPAAQRGQPRREGPDYWPTPVCLTTALVRYVLPVLPDGPIWECCAGDGRLARAMKGAGRTVLASDLYPQDGTPALDFLTGDPPRRARKAIVITNPPYNQSDEFLARGLALLDAGQTAGLVLLLRHDHLMAGGRTVIFNRATQEFHCNWRPVWIPDSDGNPRWSFHWLVWHAGSRQPPHYLDETAVAGEA